MTAPQPDPVSAARQLTIALGSVEERLAEATAASEQRDQRLDRYARRSRLYIALDVLLTVVSAAATVIALHASGRANAADANAAAANVRAAAATAAEQALHSAQVSGCVSGNQYRAGVVSSLDRLVLLLEGPHPSAVVKQAAVGYEKYVLSQNMPRDCTTAYPVKPQPKETDGAR